MRLQQAFAVGEMGSKVALHESKLWRPMSPLGHERHFGRSGRCRL
jgi:hypothetical protein